MAANDLKPRPVQVAGRCGSDGGKRMKANELLEKIGACDEAIEWAGSRTIEEAWRECERSDWMLWLVARLGGVDVRLVVRCACACAGRALRYMPTSWQCYSRAAIMVARRWTLGQATLCEVQSAADAADVHTGTVYFGTVAGRVTYATEAGYRAAIAAIYADDAVNAADGDAAGYAAESAADAAACAATADQYNAARVAELREQARVIRAIIPWTAIAIAAQRRREGE